MPIPTRTDVERRLDDLDDDSADDRIFVVAIGGDGDRPRGWLTPEEYHEHYGDPPEGGFEFDVEYPDQ